MKRTILVAFCIIVLCSMALLANTETVKAYKAGYITDDYIATITPTMDGQWTTTDEWTDAQEVHLEGSLNAIFRLKYNTAPDYSWINQYYLIEFFDDNTNDAGDYWQMCYASAATFYGDPTGGTTPQTDCLRIDFVGHSQAGLTIYKGTGTGWSVFTGYTWPDNIQIVDSISASPSNSAPHWIVEIKIQHSYTGFGIQPNFWIRVAAYDATNSAAGAQAWPASSVDVPNDWGLMNALQTVIPETFPIGVMLVLSSVAVIVGSRYFRKGTRIKSCSQGKLEK
jgi:hypothetical protein